MTDGSCGAAQYIKSGKTRCREKKLHSSNRQDLASKTRTDVPKINPTVSRAMAEPTALTTDIRATPASSACLSAFMRSRVSPLCDTARKPPLRLGRSVNRSSPASMALTSFQNRRAEIFSAAVSFELSSCPRVALRQCTYQPVTDVHTNLSISQVLRNTFWCSTQFTNYLCSIGRLFWPSYPTNWPTGSRLYLVLSHHGRVERFQVPHELGAVYGGVERRPTCGKHQVLDTCKARLGAVEAAKNHPVFAHAA